MFAKPQDEATVKWQWGSITQIYAKKPLILLPIYEPVLTLKAKKGNDIL